MNFQFPFIDRPSSLVSIILDRNTKIRKDDEIPVNAPELPQVLDDDPLGHAVLGLLADELGAVPPSEVQSLAVHDTVRDPSLGKTGSRFKINNSVMREVELT